MRSRTPAVVRSPLPPLFTRWIAEALGALPADEQTATCHACKMLPPEGHATRASSAIFFDPRSKCCTYIPELPNFLVGRVLLDTSAEGAAGRATVVDRIAARHQVTPLGLDKPPAFVVLYGNNTPDLFGRAVDLRCPHYLMDSGGCGIWRHRMSTCATWFCKHDRGEVGRASWDAIRQMLRIIERAVAVHCVRTLAPGSAALRRALADSPVRDARLRAADLGAPIDVVEHRRIWGDFAGREQEFYEACARLAEPLTWPDLLAMGGAELALATDVAREALQAAASRRVPRAVRVGTFGVAASGPESVECTTCNPFDPLSIPRVLFDLLHLFDGRPTRQALAAMSSAGIDLDTRAVRTLLDHGILVDASTG